MATLKKRVVFYTDCYIFGGCEKPIFEVLSSSEFRSKFDYLLIYRDSQEYKKGLSLFFPSCLEKEVKAVKFFDLNTFFIYLERVITNQELLRIIKKIARILFYFFAPFIMIYEFLYFFFLFLREKADIVHINNGGYPGALGCLMATIAAKSAGKKNILFSVNNMAFKKKSIFDFFIDPLISISVTLFVTASKATSLILSANRDFDKRYIINIYYGLRESRDKKDSPLPEDNLSLHDKNNSICMVARFEERKGHRCAILAFGKIIRNYPEFSWLKLFLVGDGPLLEEMKNLALTEGLENNVFFLGYRDNPTDYIAASLFLINPSLENEDLPYSIIEAMSIGIPAIATNVAGIPEEIEDGISGIIIEPGDIEALSQAMLSLLVNKELRLKMGIAAKSRFLELFTIERMIENYIKLYEKLLTQ